MSAGIIADEDLYISTTAILTNSFKMLSLTGSSANPTWNTSILDRQGLYADTDTYVNTLNAGNWGITLLTSTNQYFNMWIVATSALSNQIAVIVGQ